jgi:hypothetical protein
MGHMEVDFTTISAYVYVRERQRGQECEEEYREYEREQERVHIRSVCEKEITLTLYCVYACVYLYM